MITRKHILRKTHYGIKVFSYILRKFSPNETLKFVNNISCKPINNPFLPEKHQSLQINIEDNETVYRDLEHTNFKGDVFDFARLYFKTDTEDELLICINDALHLRLESKVSDYESRLERINQALDEFSVNSLLPSDYLN